MTPPPSPSPPAARRAAIDAAITAAGLAPRGWIAVDDADGLAALPDGRAPTALVLVGWLGRTGWSPFAAAPEPRDGRPDPLDRWSARVLGDLAEGLGGAALFPFGGPPWWPFQRWGARAEPLAVSPLGLMIHPEAGLWHGWRGALAFADDVGPIEPPTPVAAPCETCGHRRCLTNCPVDAFSNGGYDLARCLAHVESPRGALCRTDGCRARDACPVGRGRRYADDQIRFLMRAFRAAHAQAREDHR